MLRLFGGRDRVGAKFPPCSRGGDVIIAGMLLIGLIVPGAWKFILGGGTIAPVVGGFATLMLRLGGFIEGGFEMFIAGVGVRITGLICGGCSGFAPRRFVGTLMGGGVGIPMPKPVMGPESSLLTVGS